jgi:hypothetical protein
LIIAVYESIKGKIRYFMIPLYILLRENKVKGKKLINPIQIKKKMQKTPNLRFSKSCIFNTRP